MAFLDNSGDIILDAVLTDTGRLRLAQGDGSFKITKFALGDDEINYGLYNKDHSSGSAYYDLEILQTPVLEAFTNNTSNLKSKLVTISRTNILYMPSLKLNKVRVYENIGSNWGGSDTSNQNGNALTFARSQAAQAGDALYDSAKNVESNRFWVAVDQDTYDALFFYRKSGAAAANDASFSAANRTQGLIQGYTPGSVDTKTWDLIRVDQGIDSSQIAAAIGLDSDLLETAYIVESDYRLGRIKPHNSNTPTAVNFIDDDNIATYYLTQSPYVNPAGFSHPAQTNTVQDQDKLNVNNPQVFDGPRGSTLHFRVHASQELQQSTYLFTQIGNSQLAAAEDNIAGFPEANDNFIGTNTLYWIDSTIRVIGANTGYRLDIPVRYVKLK